MSKEAAAAFVERLMNDTLLQEQLDAAMAGASEPSDIIALTVGFAADHGYEVTADELQEAGDSPLSDEQLSKVAGGAETVHLYLKAR